MSEPTMHPVRVHLHSHHGPQVSKEITDRAWEVYGSMHGSQTNAVIAERGGFGITELIAFLYARTFPEDQWRERSDEAFRGIKNL